MQNLPILSLSELGMQQTIRARHGLLIFWLVFLSIAGGIVATVLFANDGRNLVRVTRAIGVETRDFAVPAPEPVKAAAKSRRIGENTAIIPAHMFLPPAAKADSSFYRIFEQIDGAALCEALRAAGFEMAPWEANAYSKSIRECAYDLSIDNPADKNNPSNFFLLVRGHSSGGVISVRAKIVMNDQGAREALGERTADMLGVLARQTEWLDLADLVPRARNLDRFDIETHGMSLRLQDEPTGPGRFNLVLMPAFKLAPAERRTMEYFKLTDFLPFAPPQYSVSHEMDWVRNTRKLPTEREDPA